MVNALFTISELHTAARQMSKATSRLEKVSLQPKAKTVLHILRGCGGEGRAVLSYPSQVIFKTNIQDKPVRR